MDNGLGPFGKHYVIELCLLVLGTRRTMVQVWHLVPAFLLA